MDVVSSAVASALLLVATAVSGQAVATAGHRLIPIQPMSEDVEIVCSWRRRATSVALEMSGDHPSSMRHGEFHRTQHIGWLRAAVLGANDGLISTSSLVVGVVAAQSARGPVLVAAVARGLTPELAGQVADQLTTHDALGAHARDELGMSEMTRARPIQAALASAAAFAVGAALPLLLVLFLPVAVLTPAVVGSSLVLLSVLGAAAARLGGAPLVAGALRVVFWGAVAMGCTALIGRLFGTVA